MTTQDHNKLLAILHLIYGGMNALVLVLMLFFFGFFANVIGNMPERSADGLPFHIFSLIMAFTMIMMGLLSIPPLVAGYGMLKQRSWAKTAGIVASIPSAISFPLGTVLCVYTLWFLLGEGRTLYDRGASRYTPGGQLHDASFSQWQEARRRETRTEEYTPPQQPPDWRS